MNKVRKKRLLSRKKKEPEKTSKIQKVLNTLVAVSAVAVGLLTIRGHLKDNFKRSPEVKIQVLKNIEKSAANKYSVHTPGKARFLNNQTHYFNVNDRLKSRLETIKLKATRDSLYASITYVTASAGAGKSWIGLGITKQVFGKKMKMISLRKLFVKPITPITGINVSQKPDLKMRVTLPGVAENPVTVSEMPYFEISIEQLLKITGASKERIVVIDDLDEIHPQASKQILRKLENYYRSATKPSISFIVFGRPEAFYPHLNNTHRRSFREVKVVNLQTPIYKNKSELKVRFDNWATRKLRDQSQKVDIFGQALKYFKQFPYLVLSLSNASSSDKVFDYIQGICVNELAPTNWKVEEQKMRKHIVDLALRRNQDTHSRPRANGLFSKEYYAMLAKVAAHYTKSEELNKKTGWFSVASSEELTVKMAHKTLRFNVSEVLDRSGLITIKPVNINTISYKFDVFWMHRYFVEYYNANLAKFNK
ncbi:hypothetical protein BKI52_24205 [marine bacterium AO1-C]|nr:hypothetical protein BKI52_24205 [marine bacterium AO1-C]